MQHYKCFYTYPLTALWKPYAVMSKSSDFRPSCPILCNPACWYFPAPSLASASNSEVLLHFTAGYGIAN
jgi:hypothetical protein